MEMINKVKKHRASVVTRRNYMHNNKLNQESKEKQLSPAEVRTQGDLPLTRWLLYQLSYRAGPQQHLLLFNTFLGAVGLEAV